MEIPRHENFVYALVEQRELEIDENGCVWRIARKWGVGKTPGVTVVRPVNQRRAERKMPGTGYLQVRASIDGITYHSLVHRLVWRHFNGEIPEGLLINHKDGDKSNNHPSNLELTTHSENNQHAVTVLGKPYRKGESHHCAILSDAAVRDIRKRRSNGESLRHIANVHGVTRNTVSQVVNRRVWAHVEDEPPAA